MVSYTTSQNASIGRIVALIKKEVIHIQSDRSTWLVAVIFPIILLVLFGMGINLDPGSIDLSLSFPSNDRPFYQQISPLLDSHAFASVYLESPQNLVQDLQSNQIRAFLQYARDRQTIVDGVDSNTANIFSATINGVLKEDQRQQLLDLSLPNEPPIQMMPRSWYNPELKTQWTLVPGSLGVILTLVATLLTSLVIAKEYEKGVIESLYATPLSPLELYVAKWVPYFGLSSIVLIGSIILATLLYQIPIRGSLLLFTLASLCFLYSAVNMGLLISISLKDQFLCSQIALMSAYMPSFMLSGFLFELTSMPFPIQGLSYLVAARYFVPCLQIFFLGGGSSTLVLKNCAGLLLLGSLWSFLSWRQLHKRIISP
jgi:ABC-2 type transport system permease protein